MSYQITISGEGRSKPVTKAEAAAWEMILQVLFPAGVTVLAVPMICPECGRPLPDSGPCWHNRFEEETVTSEEMLEALIPFQGEEVETELPTWEEMLEDGANFQAMTDIRFGKDTSGPIPFQGEPMPNKETDTKSYYGL